MGIRKWVEYVCDIARGKEGIQAAHLDLSNLRLRSLPAKLELSGSLELRATNCLRTIGNGLNVGQDLLIGGRSDASEIKRHLKTPQCDVQFAHLFKRFCTNRDCPLEELPKEMIVAGKLELSHCTHLKRIPNTAYFGGDVTIRACKQLQEIPDPFYVNGNLNLVGLRSLRQLPSSLYVKGNLLLSGLPIEALPDCLEVGENIKVENCTRLVSMPKEIRFKRNLSLKNIPATTLPATTCGGTRISIENCHGIRQIPVGVQASHSLVFKSCNALEAFAGSYKSTGDVEILDCPKFHLIHPGTTIGGALRLENCESLERLPYLLSCSRPKNRYRFSLSIKDCANVTKLHNDFDLALPIEVAGSGVRQISGSPIQYELMWDGIRINRDIVVQPEKLSDDFVLSIQNAELRRLVLERIGIEHFLARSNSRIIHEDEDAGGSRQLVELRRRRGHGLAHETLRFLKCTCPSTQRVFLLGVPQQVNRCSEAAAWLAGLNNPEDYHPIQET